MCGDYLTGLNNALIQHQHPLTVPEDIYSTLNGGKFFSQLDLSNLYLQIELYEEHKKLCAILTHKGIFEYERLVFGIKSIPAIFQSIIDQMLAGLPFATAYLNDIIIVSQTVEDHLTHVSKVLKKISDFGLKKISAIFSKGLLNT